MTTSFTDRMTDLAADLLPGSDLDFDVPCSGGEHHDHGCNGHIPQEPAGFLVLVKHMTGNSCNGVLLPLCGSHVSYMQSHLVGVSAACANCKSVTHHPEEWFVVIEPINNRER